MVNVRKFLLGDPGALPNSYSPSDFAPGEQWHRYLKTRPLWWRIRAIVRSVRLDLSWAITSRVDYHVWQYRLAQERKHPKPSYGRYEGNESVLIADFLDSNMDWSIADAGDVDAVGHALMLFPSMPWQRSDDATRYALWIDEAGFRSVYRFETHGDALAALHDLDQMVAVAYEEVED